MSRELSTPSFLLVGAAKAGTTSLFQYLSQHPDIFTPMVKEPRYFAIVEDEHKAWKGPAWMGGLDDAHFVSDWETYCSFFEGSESYEASGEASTLYLYDSKAPERIAGRLPNVHVFAVLRHPVDRAFSHWVMNWQAGVEPLESFEEALDAEDQRVADGWSPTFHYARRGRYGEQIARYQKYFPPEQLHIYLYDAYREDPERMVRTIFEQLGVSPAPVDTSGRYNAASKVPSPAMERMVSLADPLRRVLKRVLPTGVRRRIRGTVEEKLYEKPRMAPETAHRLAATFEDDLHELQDRISPDISEWLSRYDR
jgi:hypothetical protein